MKIRWLTEKLNKTLSNREFKSSTAIAVGLLGGQGVWFLFGTFSITTGRHALFGQLGVALAYATFLMFIVDMGGGYLLQRILHAPPESVAKRFVNFLALRLLVALVIVSVAIPALLHTDALWSVILLATQPIVLISVLNIQGLVDYFNKNCVVSPLQALPWVLASVCGVLSIHDVLGTRWVGLAFVAGYTIYVFSQWVSCWQHLPRMSAGLISWRGVKAEASSAMMISVAGSTSQLYPRLVLFFVERYFPSGALAAVVLAKSVSQGLMQLIAALRRVQFPFLMREAETSRPSMRVVFRLQVAPILISLALISVLTVTSALYSLPFGQYSALGTAIAAITIIWIFPSGIGQILLARGNIAEYSFAVCVSVLIAFASLFVFRDAVGVYSVVGAEFVLCTFQTLLGGWVFYRATRMHDLQRTVDL